MEERWLLGTFLDLDYLVCDKAVCLAVDGLSGFLVWNFGKAENLTALLVDILDLLVFPVSFGHRLCGQTFYALMVVHEQCHGADPPFSARGAFAPIVVIAEKMLQKDVRERFFYELR